jgi:hypothetical protein
VAGDVIPDSGSDLDPQSPPSKDGEQKEGDEHDDKEGDDDGEEVDGETTKKRKRRVLFTKAQTYELERR